MFFQSKLADFFARLAVGLVAGLLIGWLISEVSYFFLPNKQAAQRDAQVMNIVVAPGTAEKIKAGVFNSVLPNDMTFVEGDTLLVRNDDSVPHQLGPLFIPPGTSSKLVLDTANTYTYSCSFQPNKYVGLIVQPRVTLSTRFEGLLATGLPTGMMLMVYSYLVPAEKFPWKKKKNQLVVERS